MEMLIVVIAVAVLGLASMVAVGKLGAMEAEPVRDSYQPPLPPAGPLRGEDLAGITFATSARGYDMAEVDELMARMARELDGRDRRSAEQATGRTPAGAPGAEVPGTGAESAQDEARLKADRWRGKEPQRPVEPPAEGSGSPWAVRPPDPETDTKS